MHQKGFTLIEILVVMVILAFVALGIFALLPNGYKQVTAAGRLSVLNHLGYQQIDSLKSLGYSDPALDFGDHPAVIANRRLDTTDPDLTGYSIRWRVDPPDPGTPVANVKTVLVEVGYMLYDLNGSSLPSNSQNQMKQQFITYIAQP